MITVKLKLWVPVDDLDHVKTSWEVATDKEFTSESIVDSLYESENYRDIFYSKLVVPKGIVWYARAKRIFNDDTEGDWLPPTPVIDINNSSVVMVSEDTFVPKPFIYVNKEDILNPEKDSFTVTSSEFISDSDGHFSTHWIVRDDNGVIKYVSMEDEVNKTSITINKTDIENIDNLITLNFQAIYVGSNGIESEVGSTTVMLSDSNVRVDTNLMSVVPYYDLDVEFSLLDPNIATTIFKIELINVPTNTVVYAKEVSDNSHVTILGDFIKNNSAYLLYVYSMTPNKEVNTSKFSMFTTDIDNIEKFYTTIQYNNDFKLDTFDIPDEFENGVVAYEVEKSLALVPTTDNNILNMYANTPDGYVNSGYTVAGIESLSDNNVNTWVYFTPDNFIIIDTLDSDGEPVFLAYQYSKYNNTSTLISTAVRSAENDSMGKTNAIIRYDNDSFLYLPTNSNVIKKYNYKTGEITDFKTAPNTNMTNGVLISIDIGRFIVVGGDDLTGWLYDESKDEFRKGIAIPPDFRSRELKVLKLYNNNTIIYRTVYNEDVDTNSRILVFNSMTNAVTSVGNTIVTSIFPTSSILRTDGSVVLWNKNDDIKYVYS